MPVLPNCANCDRLGGYAEKETDKVCYRCKKKLVRKPERKDEESETKV